MLWGSGWGYGPHMWLGGGIFMGLFWIAVIVALVYLIKYLSRQSAVRGGRGETAMDILKKRYARGEITKEQYDRMRDDLKD